MSALRLILLLPAFLVGGSLDTVAADLQPVQNLRVEYFRNPLSVSTTNPRFSWELPTGLARGVGQKSYQIIVARPYTDFGPIWESGIVESDATHGIVCNVTLPSNTLYEVVVKWVSSSGETSAIAQSKFGVGPMDAKDWSGAQWLGGQTQRQMRGSFVLNATQSRVAYAVMHVAAPGCAVVTVNGKAVDSGVGICTWTQFQHTVLYSTLDISQVLTEGENVIGLLLGHSVFGDSKGAMAEPTIMVKLDVGLRPSPAPPGSSLQRYTVVSAGAAPLPPAPSPPGPPRKGGCGGKGAGMACLCAIVDEHESLKIGCASGTKISGISFLSFGKPSGKCDGGVNPSGDTFKKDPTCDAPGAMAEMEKACVGKESCTIVPKCDGKKCTIVAGGKELPDPCNMQHKHVSVAIECGASATIPPPGPHGSPAQVIASTWTAVDSYIVSDDPWAGTNTDWGKATACAGWDSAAFPAKKLAAWSPAAQSSALLVSQLPVPRVSALPPTAVIRTLSPLSVSKLANGDYVYKFPENFVGVAQIQPGHVKLTGAGGGTLTLQHSEMLLNGTKPGFNRDPAAGIDPAWAWNEQKDMHIFAPGFLDTALTPLFTWHGGQFVQVTASAGVELDGAKDALLGLVLHSNLTQTGELTFGGGKEADALNALQGIILNSQTSNVAAGTPTDCPTREKHGWLGDGQVTAEEAMYNFDMLSVYEEFLNMIQDTQHNQTGDIAPVAPVPVKFKHGPKFDEVARERLLEAGSAMPRTRGGKGGMADLSWTAAYPLISHWLYKYYGDTKPILQHWASLKKYMDGVHDAASTSEGALPAFWTWGDWCAVESRAIATPGTGPELAAFNYILGLDAMEAMAEAVGEQADAAKYKALGLSMRVAFKQVFYNETLQRYAPRAGDASNELLLQSLNVAPLAMAGSRPAAATSLDVGGLVDKLHADVLKNDFHFTVGSVGAKHLLPQLSANGLHADAMKIAAQQTHPSFGYWIANGATTCWEDYSGLADPTHPPTPTHNHIFLCGGAGEWLYRSVLGVEPAAPGWKKVAVRPLIIAGGPASASGHVLTVRGKVSVQWRRAPAPDHDAHSAAALLTVTIPAGATAQVAVPVVSALSASISESGKPVWAAGAFVAGVAGVTASKAQVEGAVTFEVASGTYAFAQ